MRIGAEKEKMRAGIKPNVQKRKRSDMDDSEKAAEGGGQGQEEGERRTKKIRGPKGPNPLSVKKPKRRIVEEVGMRDAASSYQRRDSSLPGTMDEVIDQAVKAKRKRKHRSSQAIQ